MTIITQNKRYLPHEITTKVNSVKFYRSTRDISFVCRRYHISKASLMRWNKQYNGTTESLLSKSHKPHTPHPNAHTSEELKWIADLHRRTLISLFVNFIRSLERNIHTAYIPVLYTAYLLSLDIVKRLSLQRRSQSTMAIITHQQN